MKTIRYILTVAHSLLLVYLGVGVFLFFLFSCTSQKENPQLLRADSLMEMRPDSALLLLEGITSTQKLSRSDQALYALLLTQARHKNYVTLNDDSLIKTAVNYYGSEKKNFRAAQAYYYWGATYRDKGNIPFAVEQYLKAIELMPHQNAFLAMMYNNLGDCYQAENLYDVAMASYRKAYQIRQDNNKENYFSLRGIGHTFLLQHQLDSACSYFKKAYDYVVETKDSSGISVLCSDLAIAYFEKKEYSKANDFVSKSAAIYPGSLRLKGLIMLHLNQLDSARYYFEQNRDELDISSKAAYYDGMYQIEKRSGNWKAVAQNLETYMVLYDSIQILSDTEKLDRLMDNHKLEKHKRDLSQQQRELTERLVVGLLFIVFIGVFLFFWVDRKRKKNYIILQQRLTQKRVDAISLYAKELLEFEEGHENELIELRKQQFNICLSIFKTNEYYTKLQDLEKMSLKELKLERAFRAKLNDVIREVFIDVMENLKRTCPALTNDDLLFCILSLLSCSKNVIMELMNVSPDALKMRKSRIKSKMDPELFEYIFLSDNQ